jgi:hypothetical protein
MRRIVAAEFFPEAVIPEPPKGWNPESMGLFSGGSGFRVALRLPGMTKPRFAANQDEA